MTGNSKRRAVCIAAALGGLSVMASGQAATAASLLGDDLATFAVLGATTVTNVPASEIGGNVGVWAGTSITGFNSVAGEATDDLQVTGKVHADTALAQSAQGQLTTAINGLGSLGAGTVLASADLAGLVLAPGVYTVAAGTTNLSGTLTLDGGGNLKAAWVFQLASTLITSPNATVNMIGTGAGAGLFWNVGSSATIDTNTTFLGNILAKESISVNTGASILCGRTLAETGAVTLQQNSISGTCDGALAGSLGLSGGLEVSDDGTVGFLQTAVIPLPASVFLLLGALGGLGLFARRRTA